jgi:hypothetical protein
MVSWMHCLLHATGFYLFFFKRKEAKLFQQRSKPQGEPPNPPPTSGFGPSLLPYVFSLGSGCGRFTMHLGISTSSKIEYFYSLTFITRTAIKENLLIWASVWFHPPSKFLRTGEGGGVKGIFGPTHDLQGTSKTRLDRAS